MNDLRRQLKRQKNLVIGGLITLGIVILAIFAPLLAPYDPINQADLLHSEESPNHAFLFGTDTQGRDILSRVIYGARISLSIGLIGIFITMSLGMIVGGVSVTRTLPDGTPDDVRKEIKWLVENGPKQGLMLGGSSSVVPNTNRENIKAAIEGFRYYREHGRG